MVNGDRDIKIALAFKFSGEDLTLNRQGRIGAGQKQALGSSRNARMISIIAYVAMLGLALLICLGVGVSLLINGNESTIRLAIMFAMAVAMLAIAGGAANYYIRSRDLLTGKVSQMEGTAKLSTRQYNADYGGLAYSNLGTGWFVKLGSKNFRLLTAEQYAVFEEGAAYRIYYVKNYPIDLILSAEAIS